MKKDRRKGQTILEYLLVFACFLMLIIAIVMTKGGMKDSIKTLLTRPLTYFNQYTPMDKENYQ